MVTSHTPSLPCADVHQNRGSTSAVQCTTRHAVQHDAAPLCFRAPWPACARAHALLRRRGKLLGCCAQRHPEIGAYCCHLRQCAVIPPAVPYSRTPPLCCNASDHPSATAHLVSSRPIPISWYTTKRMHPTCCKTLAAMLTTSRSAAAAASTA
jgi:hypothetical protein